MTLRDIGVTLCDMGANGRAAIRAAALVVVTAGLLVPYLALGWTGRGLRRRLVGAWHRAACRLAGLRVQVHGQRASGPALLAANHISYLDIPAIASRLDVVFVAKREVASWPAIGRLAALAGTIFVAREGREAVRQVTSVAGAMAHDGRVVIFPEGTSTIGRRVRPFKSTLFEAALTPPGALVQPVTVAYLRDHRGRALDAAGRRRYAWIDDDTLVPHLWRVMKHSGITVDVMFHRPVAASALASRKALADYCHDQSAAGLAYLERLVASVASPAPSRDGLWADWADFPAFATFD